MGKFDPQRYTGNAPSSQNSASQKRAQKEMNRRPAEMKQEENKFYRLIRKWGFQIRTVLMALPVAVIAVLEAIWNLAALPAKVGFDLQTDGRFVSTVPKIVAIAGPLAVTAACLLLMFCSKRTVYPWLISIFSLALPLVVLLVNTFPG